MRARILIGILIAVVVGQHYVIWTISKNAHGLAQVDMKVMDDLDKCVTENRKLKKMVDYLEDLNIDLLSRVPSGEIPTRLVLPKEPCK